MLKKIHRLFKTSDFERVFKKGKSCYSKRIGLKVLPNNSTVSRFGLVVSTKVAKKANKRNLLKRRLRAIIKQWIKRIKPGYDFMIITLPGASELEYQELEREIERLLKQLRLFS